MQFDDLGMSTLKVPKGYVGVTADNQVRYVNPSIGDRFRAN
ncbi:hypothetical protein [Bacillus sp. ISL-4]|nr:hypothetical protein [Bacillus sp. ISL-4]